MEIHARETKHFNDLNELALYQQQEIKKFLDGNAPSTAPVKKLQFHLNGLSYDTQTEETDILGSYGIELIKEITVDIDPLSKTNKKP